MYWHLFDFKLALGKKQFHLRVMKCSVWCGRQFASRNICLHSGNPFHLSQVMRKPTFCLCENKGAFVFTTRIVQFLYFVIMKFQASSLHLWLCRQVCVRPGRKHWRLSFSCHGSFHIIMIKSRNGKKGNKVHRWLKTRLNVTKLWCALIWAWAVTNFLRSWDKCPVRWLDIFKV